MEREGEGDGGTTCDWRAWNASRRVENRKTNRDYPGYGIIKSG